LNLQKKIIFLGKMPHNKTMAIMKTFDIFVNPSYTEGLPTSILEASLCKNAIIATNVGGTNEIITNNQNGYLIEPKNIELLKDKIINLIKNSAKRQIFSKNACKYVKENFSWNKSIKKYLNFLKP
jgi:glycosyltransferase involved in cell wall biosynthesis